MLSRNGSSRKDVTERLAKARKHFNTPHHFWRHTGLPLHWKLRIYNAVLCAHAGQWNGVRSPHTGRPSQAGVLPFEGVAEDAPHPSHLLHEGLGLLTANHFQSTITTTRLTATPHTLHSKLFGHILKASAKRLERDCCFTSAFHYRGGEVGGGLRSGRPRTHWAEQCAALSWHWLQDLPNPPSLPKAPQFRMHGFNFTGRLSVDNFGFILTVKLHSECRGS